MRKRLKPAANRWPLSLNFRFRERNARSGISSRHQCSRADFSLVLNLCVQVVRHRSRVISGDSMPRPSRGQLQSHGSAILPIMRRQPQAHRRHRPIPTMAIFLLSGSEYPSSRPPQSAASTPYQRVGGFFFRSSSTFLSNSANCVLLSASSFSD